VRGNSIHSNGGLGYDQDPPGVTPPTGFTITSVTTSTNEINGSMANSHPGIDFTFTLDFYKNAQCDPSGYGEGEIFLGTMDVYVERVSTSPFTFPSTVNLLPGDIITATTAITLTTEFTPCFVVADNTPVGTNVVVPVEDPVTGDTPVTVTFDNVSGAGNTSLVVAGSGPPPPSGFAFGNSYFEITSDATFDSVEVCVTYDDGDIPGEESDLQLLHYNDVTMMWDNTTTSHDMVNNILCGRTDSFSPFMIAADIATGIGDTPATPREYALYQNHPNPFNPTTTIAYDLPSAAYVTLDIFDVKGRRIRTLQAGDQSAGRRAVVWDGRNDTGEPVATGVYFYRLSAGSFTTVRKMVVIK